MSLDIKVRDKSLVKLGQKIGYMLKCIIQDNAVQDIICYILKMIYKLFQPQVQCVEFMTYVTIYDKTYAIGCNFQNRFGIKNGNSMYFNWEQLPLSYINSITCYEYHTVFDTNKGLYRCIDFRKRTNNDLFRTSLEEISTYQVISEEVPTNNDHLLQKLQFIDIRKIITIPEIGTYIITNYGNLYLWNDNTLTNLNISNISYYTAGKLHCAFVTIFGEIYMCGDNYYGQLGIDDEDPTTHPQKINLSLFY